MVSNNCILMYKCSVANNNNNNKIIVGWDNVVRIATRYGLHSPGIESWWGLDFLHPSRLAHPVGTRSFPGVRRPGRGVDHPPQYSAEVKERVELYLYSTSGPS